MPVSGGGDRDRTDKRRVVFGTDDACSLVAAPALFLVVWVDAELARGHVHEAQLAARAR